MTNPHLEMMKQNRALQQSRRQDIQSLVGLGHLTKQNHDLQASAPDPRQPFADMLGQTAQGVVANRPARGWRALIAGMLEGASTGLKSQVAQEKKDKAEQLGQFFSWLEGNVLGLSERNQQIQTQRQAQEELEPMLKDYAQNRNDLSPLAKEKYAEHILNRYNQMTGSEYTLAAIDQVNPLKVAVRDPKQRNQVYLKDFSEEVGGVDAELYQKALAFEDRKFDQNQARLSIAQQNAEAYQQDIQSRWNPEKQFWAGLGKQEAKKFSDAVQKAEQENATLEDALYATKEAKDLLATRKVIAGSDLGAYFQRLTGKALNTEGMTITQLYDTATAQLYEFAKGNISFGNTNQKEFDFLKDRIPESSKTPKALALMLERFEKKIERKMAKNEELINKMPDYRASSFGNTPRMEKPAAAEYPVQADAGRQETRTFKVRAPTGEIVLVPESDIDEAMAHGGTVVSR